jgi:pimeloyl-ACP methyl ester carboxylesterase
VLLHSLGLSHREWEPIVAPLSARFRVVVPDLPLHGDSEDRPRHPYTIDWLSEVISGFCNEVLGPRPLVAGHDLGAELALHAVTSKSLRPARMVLMPTRLHTRERHRIRHLAWRVACRPAALPGMDRLLSRAAPLVFRPSVGESLYPQIDLPVLLLWTEESVDGAREALDLLPSAQLRTLPGTGFLLAYDDPVGVARELIAFCG